MHYFDVIIIGAGPAALFAAYAFANESDLSVLVIDKGKDLPEREREMREQGNQNPEALCNLVHGFGGAGLFSDGKLCLSLKVGGHLDQL